MFFSCLRHLASRKAWKTVSSSIVFLSSNPRSSLARLRLVQVFSKTWTQEKQAKNRTLRSQLLVCNLLNGLFSENREHRQRDCARSYRCFYMHINFVDKDVMLVVFVVVFFTVKKKEEVRLRPVGIFNHVMFHLIIYFSIPWKAPQGKKMIKVY